MSNKTIVAPVEIPGMQISFQSPVGPSGKGISFVGAVPIDCSLDDLNERLDVIAAAARRQDAFEQLRLDQNSLAANKKLLAKAKAARGAAQNVLEGKLTVVGDTRRRAPDATRVAPGELNAVMQHDQRIVEIEGQIVGCEERIPFWKAILRGEEPLDLGEPANDRMAAE
jgi:hypothetical protein